MRNGESPRSALFLPVFHPRLLDAGVAGGRGVLHRELPQAAGHHGHGAELAAGAEAGAAGILSVQPVLGAPALDAVLGAHKGDLHAAPAGSSASCLNLAGAPGEAGSSSRAPPT